MTMAGSRLATLTRLSQTRLMPTQKISTEPTMDRFAKAAAVMTGRRRPAKAVTLPCKIANRNRGENRPTAHRTAHNHNDDKIQHRFGGEDGIVPGDAVLDGADDGHGADADRQRGGDKGIHKPLILGITGFLLEPLAEALKGTFQIQQLSDHRADGQAADDQHGTMADDGPVFHGEHLLQRPGDGNEQSADATAFGQRVQHLLLEKPAEQRASRTASYDGGGIDNGSQTVHFLFSLSFCRQSAAVCTSQRKMAFPCSMPPWARFSGCHWIPRIRSLSLSTVSMTPSGAKAVARKPGAGVFTA